MGDVTTARPCQHWVTTHPSTARRSAAQAAANLQAEIPKAGPPFAQTALGRTAFVDAAVVFVRALEVQKERLARDFVARKPRPFSRFRRSNPVGACRANGFDAW